MIQRLSGQVAVVTGGASGIGQACAVRLAEEGARVVIADLNLESAEKVAGELSGDGHRGLVMDVNDEESIRAGAEAVPDTTILVTSAGIAHKSLRPHELSTEEWDAVMRTNVRGTYLCAVAFGTEMARSGRGGSIVAISSASGLRSTGLHSYGPGKAAVNAMVANLSVEWGRSGVRVNAVAPGYTLTPTLKGLIDIGHRDPATLEEASALGRIITPEEVAAPVAFLAGPDASGITGVTIPVDAGWQHGPNWATYGGVRASYSNE